MATKSGAGATVAQKSVVKLTANFERNLGSIEQFLIEAEACHTFDALLDELAETIIPNLERFPDIGQLFLSRSAHSVEGINALDALRNKLDAVAKDADLREYLFFDYLLLYANCGDMVYLLFIKHHRQLSFDLQAIWLAS